MVRKPVRSGTTPLAVWVGGGPGAARIGALSLPRRGEEKRTEKSSGTCHFFNSVSRRFRKTISCLLCFRSTMELLISH